jgi:hypothetical protein
LLEAAGRLSKFPRKVDVPLHLDEIKKKLLENFYRVSGKPVIVQADERFSGHATLKLANGDQPAHVLLYKPVHEPDSPEMLVIILRLLT